MSTKQKSIPQAVLDRMEEYKLSPFPFIDDMWGLVPQPINPDKQERFNVYFEDKRYDEITEDFFEPYIEGKHLTWQQFLILKAVEFAVQGKCKKRISVRSGHGIGKCFSRNTDILMFDGSIKKVQDILVGDKLMGDDNTPRNVLSLATGEEMMWRVRYFDGSYYDINESHVLSLVASQSHGKQKSGNIIDISLKNYFKKSERWKRTNIGYKKSIELSEKLVDIDPYLLGLWLGDGNSSSGKIYNVDKEILEYLDTLSTQNKVQEKSGCWKISIKGLTQKLRKYDLLQNKHIPDIYLQSSRKQRLNLLAGLLDTDGSVDKGKRQFSITQKNQKLAENIKFLAQSVGCHATLNEVKKYCYYKGKKREGNYYIVNISRNTEIIPTKIKRKQILKIKNPQRNNLHFGFTLEPLKKDIYYGFEIDGNKRFLLGDFTVTHNTTVFAWALLWYLFCHFEAQIPVTAPSQTQMYDALWKETYKQLKKMPLAAQRKYDWQSSYIRMVERPNSWFARAKTARKESPEALAGIHADHVLMLIDEASGVHEEIFKTAEGALTEESILVIMISNPTRNIGYFYESQKGLDMQAWERFKFSTTDCPRVSDGYEQRIIRKHGKDSDEYKIRVLGEFPDVEQVDDEGYSPLFITRDIKEIDNPGLVNDIIWIGTPIMGLDPAGEGKDETVWVVRDQFKAKIVLRKKLSDERKIAAQTATLMQIHGVKAENVYIDSFGIGHKCAIELTRADYYINAINVGDVFPKDDENADLYINIRAKNYYTLRNWLRSGGELVRDPAWEIELPSIKYRRQAAEKSRIQVMSKIRMKKAGYKSPDTLDALALTFTDDDGSEQQKIVTITPSQMAARVDSNKPYSNRIPPKQSNDPFAPI